MIKRLLMAIVAISVIALAGYSQDLSTICLKDDVDSLLGSGALDTLADTSMLSRLKVVGTCDSVTLMYDTSIGGFPITLPMAVVKKLNKCSLGVVIMLAGMDTVINYCEAINIKQLRMISGAAGTAGLRALNRDGMTIIAYSAPSSMSPAELKVMSLQGALISTFALTQRSGIAIWEGKDSRGKAVSAGRYVLVLKAGSFLKSIEIVK